MYGFFPVLSKLSQFGCILGWTSGPFWALFNPFHPSSVTQARFPPAAESVGADGWEKLCEVLLSEYFPLIFGLAQWIWRDRLEARTICTKRSILLHWPKNPLCPLTLWWLHSSKAISKEGFSCYDLFRDIILKVKVTEKLFSAQGTELFRKDNYQFWKCWSPGLETLSFRNSNSIESPI